jgi:hypothetical protein
MTNPKEMNKKPYQEPRVIDYGKVKELTRKSGSKSDGNPAMKGTKNIGF